MARPLRLEYPGAVYHATSRGNEKRPIFTDDEERAEFLRVLCLTKERYNWLVHAYCLMGNHYHLLVETPDGNLSAGMRHLNGVYTQWFNRRHNRTGHLLQGRFKAVLVEKDSYLLELCRYVVLNPVRAGIVKAPLQWQWSSYRATVGQGKGIACLSVEWLLSQFGGSVEEAVEGYKAFVREGMGTGSPWAALKGQVVLGGEGFIEQLNRNLEGKGRLKEIPRAQRYAGRPLLGEILKGVGRDKQARDRAVYESHVRYGYKMREIAEHLGAHYATISRAIKREEAKGQKV